MSYTEWNQLTPKEKEMVVESQEEIRKIQADALKPKTGGQP
jgi:hypothetical protein